MMYTFGETFCSVLEYVVCLKSKCTDFPMYELVA